MTCYVFANCALFDIPLEGPAMYTGKSISNMRTDGILRLLKGESFKLHPEDRAMLFATPQWQKLHTEYHQNKHTSEFPLEGYYEFQSISPQKEDVFLWSPFADCLCSYTEARCEDESPYPSMYWPISDVFKHRERISFEKVMDSWHQLIQKLSHVQKKGIVLYPPDLILELEPDTPHRENILRHVRLYNTDAASLFSAYGWKVFTPEAIVNEKMPHWSHYSWRSRRNLWKEIQKEFSIEIHK